MWGAHSFARSWLVVSALDNGYILSITKFPLLWHSSNSSCEVLQINIVLLSVAILSNDTLLDDLNRRFPVLGPRLLELSKSLGSEDMVSYVWDRLVRFFLGNQTTITPDNSRGFLDVSKKTYPRNRSWKPTELWDAEDPTLSIQSAHSW
jgi:hypothetical protein